MLREYKGHLCGDFLSEKTCERLLKLHEMQARGMALEQVRHSIYDLSEEDVDKIIKTKTTLDSKPLGTLTDLQTLGVGYMAMAKRVLLGDSVGMGKTPQSAGLIQYLKQKTPKFRFIYFTEKKLVEKDHKELIRFTGDYIHKLTGDSSFLKKEMPKYSEEKLPYSFVASHSVIKSSIFQEWVLVYMKKYKKFPFDLIIIDEASAVATTSEKSEYYKSAKALCDKCDRVVLLNATPFESRLESFRLQLTLVDPTFLPKKTEFKKRFQKTRFNGEYIEYLDEYKNAEAFKEAIKLRFLSRKRKETGGTMTNCQAKLIVVDKSPTQRRLEKLTSIPQMVYDCPSALDRTVKMTINTTPKLKTILDLVENQGKDEKTILIYCRYKESQDGIIETLEGAGYSCRKLNGETKDADRIEIVEDFKQGKYKILVTNVQKGLNFGNCNMTIFYSALPNPNQMVQVEGRMTRDYHIENKRIFVLATKGREQRTLQEVIAGRAKASEDFAGSDFSLVLDLLRNNSDSK